MKVIVKAHWKNHKSVSMVLDQGHTIDGGDSYGFESIDCNVFLGLAGEDMLDYGAANYRVPTACRAGFGKS